tara:strand:- start:1126 stop:1575 length:450 start_codon:yes stop_codon:yes gene_type:complete
MTLTTVFIKKVSTNKDFNLPKYQTEGSVGMDLSASINENIVINPGEWKLIPSGIAISLPENLEAQIRPRSGLAAKYGLTVLNSPGTIDTDYRGEIKVILINHSSEIFTVKNNERIAQMVFNEVKKISLKEVDDLDDTNRGKKGFGSTGQ